jgi:HAD superfamily phosphatase (TIGR01668 family)
MTDLKQMKKALVRIEVPFDRLRAITPDRLRVAGIKAIFIDLENTLLPYGATKLPAQATDFLRRLVEADLTVCIASNAAASPAAKQLSAEGLPYRLRCWKPFSLSLRAWIRANQIRGYETLVIGDQVLTDGLLSILLRSHLLLIVPLSAAEPIWARTQRVIGRLVKPFLFARGKTEGFL